MNRILTASLLLSLPLVVAAQTPPVINVRIDTTTTWAAFYVDGQQYVGTANVLWPQGTKHIVEFPNLNTATTAACAANFQQAIQFSPNLDRIIAFGGWKDAAGRLLPTADPVQSFTADPSLTSLTANLTVSYRVAVQMFDAQSTQVPCSPGTSGAPGAPPPDLRPGIVYVNGTTYWNSATTYIPAGTITLNAFPYPGFVFDNWTINGSGVAASVTTWNLQAPLILGARFEPAKRVRFLTAPLGLHVLVDRTEVPTLPYLDPTLPCPIGFLRAPAPPPGIPALCRGDFDFAPNSSHLISAPSPQQDLQGNYWVFGSWDRGGGQNTVYKVDTNTATMDTLTADFVPGAQIGFFTNPPGMKLTVDGRQNWPAYTFIWGLGETHQVSAGDQTGSNGRKYTFKGWSNSGPAAQTITVDQSTVTSGLRMYASFDVLSRLVVQSSPPGLAIQVDGTSCTTPCTIDRPGAAQVHVTAPSSISVDNNTRLDFASWSDNGASDHVYTLNSDMQTLTVNYRTMYRLAAAGDPANGVSFDFSPASPDMFYPANTQVSITATAKPGYKFRRWGGDVDGTYPVAQAGMTSAMNVIARLDRVPYIPPAGIKNAAGDTPGGTVAPGSIIAIFGASLTTDPIVGPTNPLSQSLGGVVVTVGDRILPLLYVSPDQINAQLPSDLAEGQYVLRVSATGQPDVTGVFTVAVNSPGLFSRPVDSKAYALAAHADGTPVTPDSPAIQGETITVYGTGFGALQNKPVDGFVQGGPPNPLVDSLQIQLGDFTPAAVWSGASPDYVGMMVTKFQITPDLPSATTLELKINVNGKDSNTVLLPLQ